MTDIETGIIRVTQLPVIEDEARLRALKDYWDQKAKDAEATICTEENRQSLKKERAEMRKEFEALKVQKKEALAPITATVAAFDDLFRECVVGAFERADAAFASGISTVENGLKQEREDALREYFAELCAAEHVDFLRFEQTGVKVNLSSSQKKLREQLATFVSNVARDVEAIADMEDAEEVVAEYRNPESMAFLNFAASCHAVLDRHRRVEAEKERLVRYSAAQEARREAVKKVETVAPPVALEPPKETEKEYRCTFTVYATKDKLRALKQYMIQEGIRYE